jgi:hypothetical protein
MNEELEHADDVAVGGALEPDLLEVPWGDLVGDADRLDVAKEVLDGRRIPCVRQVCHESSDLTGLAAVFLFMSLSTD